MNMFNRNIYLILIFLLILAGGYFVYSRVSPDTTDSGSWECVNEEWVAVGEPLTPKPETVCGSGNIGDVRDGLIVMRYQPRQCVETPWQIWYKERSGPMDGAVSQETMIREYLEARNVEIDQVVTVETGDNVCMACEVCPTTFYFEASVAENSMETLLAEGWTQPGVAEIPDAGTGEPSEL
jgi:hypothetical protein